MCIETFGESWNFVIWGLLHGGYLAIHKVITDKFPGIKIHPFFKTKTGKIVSILTTQYFVFLAWIPFRASDTDHMLYAIEKYIFIDFQSEGIATFLMGHKWPIVLMILFFILHFITYLRPDTVKRVSKVSLKWWTVILSSILLAIVFFFNGNPEDFIYFRF